MSCAVLGPTARRSNNDYSGMLLPRLRPCTSFCLIPALLIVLVTPAAGAAAANDQYSEDQVKAAFLFHFAAYAEWPPGVLGEEITFAVLNAETVARELELFAHDRTLHDRPVRVRRIRSILELRGAEVLFVGSGQNRRLPQIIAAVKTPTLVVTDVPDGLPAGGMINFQTVGRRVRFEIAVAPAQEAGLNLSSRLLSAAMRVEMSRCYLECRLLDAHERLTRVARRSIDLRTARSV